MAENPKLRVLCLHGFRTSGAIFKAQQSLALWSRPLGDLLDLVFLDAPFPASGKSDVEAFFDGPYFEWWAASADFKVYTGFEESVAFVADYISMHGPFHGLMGFSQGGTLSASFMALQQQGKLPKAPSPPVSFCVVIGGSTPRADNLQDLLKEPLECPTLHFIGERDFLRRRGEMLQVRCKDPVVIRHPLPHQVPRLDAAGMQTFRNFLVAQQNIIAGQGLSLKDTP